MHTSIILCVYLCILRTYVCVLTAQIRISTHICIYMSYTYACLYIVGGVVSWVWEWAWRGGEVATSIKPKSKKLTVMGAELSRWGAEMGAEVGARSGRKGLAPKWAPKFDYNCFLHVNVNK